MIKHLLLLASVLLVFSNDVPGGISAYINPYNSIEDRDGKEIYKDGKLKSHFNPNYVKGGQSCTPAYLVAVENDEKNPYQTIEIINTGKTQYKVIKTYVNNSNPQIPAIILVDQVDLPANGVQYITITQTCPQTVTDDNFWSELIITIEYDQFTLHFSYEFTCDPYQRDIRFNYSLMILVFIDAIGVTLLARFGKIYSILIPRKSKFNVEGVNEKSIFQGFDLDWKWILGYILVYVGVVTMSYYRITTTQSFALVSIFVIGFCGCFFLLDEILCLASKGTFLMKTIFWKARVSELISLIFASLMAILYGVITKAWYINDIVAMCITGSLVKILKIQSLKKACIFMLPAMLVDVLISVTLHYSYPESYNILVLKYYNFPLELELPEIGVYFEKKCAWLSITSIAIPGFFIGYCYRFDINTGGFIYTLLAFLALLLGQFAWVVNESFNPHSFPISTFTFWLMILVTALWAMRRGEFTTIWNGSFYDQYLERNYRADSFFAGELQEGGNISMQLEKSGGRLDKSVFQGLKVQKDEDDEIFNPLLNNSTYSIVGSNLKVSVYQQNVVGNDL